MRKAWAVAAVCLLAVGCHMNKPGRHGVVYRITVECQDKRAIYTDQEKMSQILNALRQLGQKTLAREEPDLLPEQLYQITLERSDGKSTVYHTAGERFLQINQEPWKQTEPKALWDLLHLLEELPPDG